MMVEDELIRQPEKDQQGARGGALSDEAKSCREQFPGVETGRSITSCTERSKKEGEPPPHAGTSLMQNLLGDQRREVTKHMACCLSLHRARTGLAFAAAVSLSAPCAMTVISP